MRVSDRQRYDIANNRVNQSKDDNARMLEQLSTQKKINRISDDPIGAGQMLKRRTQITNADQYLKNIEFSKGYIERTEASLTGIYDFLIRAKELSVSLANDTYDATSRKAAAGEMKQIVDGVIGLANSTYGNRYIFGGFRTLTPPVSADGRFTGDDGAIFLQIDDGRFRQINLQARDLFEPNLQEREAGRFGMIQTLETLKDGLANDDIQAIRKAMDELEVQLDKASSYQATLGSIYNALEENGKRLELTKEMTQEDLSRIEDADIYKATSDFKRTESVLQSTLMASNKLLQPSLMNFLQ